MSAGYVDSDIVEYLGATDIAGIDCIYPKDDIVGTLFVFFD